MSDSFKGYFYLKQTNNKNLLGEFSNNKMKDLISTESCDYQEINNKKEEGKFVGKYKSTWQQDGKSFIADLEISFLNNSSTKKYHLCWEEKSIIYIGEGILCDDTLIGYYTMENK